MKLVIPPLYAIIDAAQLRCSAVALAETLADSGVGIIQYRDKQASPRKLLILCRELVSLLKGRSVRLVINDRPDIAALAGAGGVHVGQDDLGVDDARAVCGRSCWVGVSTHNEEQLRAADETSADYIAIGPIFPTTTKGRPDPVVGTEFVRRARSIAAKPLVAIGGITLENAASVWRAGADSVAVARDLMSAEQPGKRAREYLDLAAGIFAERS